MAGLKFEQALKKLEKIVEELEKGELSLDDSLKKYEEGIRLSRFCGSKLEEVERKVEVLSKAENGKLKRVPYEAPKKGKKEDDGGLLFEKDN